MRVLYSAVFVAAVISTSGCAFQKQAIRVQPAVNVSSSNLGGGKLTMVSVSDERPRATLGTRGVGGIGEQLTLDGELVTTIKAAVSEGLQRQGFLTTGPMENQLRVEIRNLDYVINSGFWAGKLNIEFLLKGICIKGNARPYEQMYRGEFRKNVQMVQGAESNSEFVNQVVSQAVNALLNDSSLTNCLAQ